jgi:hypothetical protein
MTLPDPRATRLQNLVATMLRHGNAKRTVKLDILALHNKPWTADEIGREFDRQETRLSLQPRQHEEFDGK